MKVAAIFAAAATASPTGFIVNNWWEEAVNVFGYASSNWAQFAAAADTVSSIPLRVNFCNEFLRYRNQNGNHCGTFAMLMAILKFLQQN